MVTEHTIVDLFCGCGGFGLGAELAGFRSIVGIDIDSTLQSAYKMNFPNSRVFASDISKMDESTWRLILNTTKIDGVIGGPPCQGYSRMGLSNENDPRRSLIKDFFRTVNIIYPKFFIMENVEGLLDKKNKKELDNALSILNKDYKVLEPMILDASNYGAPTKRKRVIVVGYLPQHFIALNRENFTNSKFQYITVKDAIYDLGKPVPQVKDISNYGWGKYRKLKKISNYALEMRKSPPQGIGNDLFINKMNEGIVSGFYDTTHAPNIIERYLELEPGKIDTISKSKKLQWNGFCPTLRAGTGADKGSFQAVRPIHPQQGRVITVREAARLQGFPDWFGFHHTKWHSFRMIGNSVSPIFSKALLSIIKENIISENTAITKLEENINA